MKCVCVCIIFTLYPAVYSSQTNTDIVPHVRTYGALLIWTLFKLCTPSAVNSYILKKKKKKVPVPEIIAVMRANLNKAIGVNVQRLAVFPSLCAKYKELGRNLVYLV